MKKKTNKQKKKAKQTKNKILYEIIIICSFLVSPLECAQIDGGRWPVIPSQLNAQSQQFTILWLVDYFQPPWLPQDLFPASLPTFINWKYYEGNFLLPATSNFHITFSGPCSLRTTATTKSISNGVLDGVTWITKNQNALKMCSKKWVLLTHCWWF